MDFFQHFPTHLMRAVLESAIPRPNLYWYHGLGAASKENSSESTRIRQNNIRPETLCNQQDSQATEWAPGDSDGVDVTMLPRSRKVAAWVFADHRDRDGSYGERFREAAQWLGIREVLTAPQSPWQNAYVERLIGSIRRECLDHVIVVNEKGLRRILKCYFDYYERTRTHLSLGKDAPVSRPVQQVGKGRIVEIPQVGGLHHRYERVAA
jgi:transposase InsO family protein